jgi:phosphoribosylformimino-5-aminoimidazole carboxamide ribotide isomerase
MISVNGWQDVQIHIVAFLKDYVQRIEHVPVPTSALMECLLVEYYAVRKVLLSFPTLLIASGGVSCLDDLHELKRIGVDGVIVGKAIYEGKISLEELTNI